MENLQFRTLHATANSTIDVRQIEVLNLEGIRVLVEIPTAAWLDICRIARAGRDDPREHLARLSMSAWRRAHRSRSSTMSARITRIRSRSSI